MGRGAVVEVAYDVADLIDDRPEWMTAADCVGQVGLFFGPPNERPPSRLRREAAAKAICRSCPVLEQCREYARRHRERGVWGGETDEERAAAVRRDRVRHVRRVRT
jgi:WhiB family redox-sensing transcriptional regulator